MAALGGKEAEFNKPYLKMVASDIEKGNKIKFINGSKEKIEITKEIKKFIKGVNDNNISNVNLSMRGTTLKSGKFIPIFNGNTWTKIDKSPYSGMGGTGKPDAKTTAMQELASLYSIEIALENGKYTDRTKFFSEHRDKLVEIYPNLNEDWENTLFEQQKTTYDQINKGGKFKFGHYSRDGGFMDYITQTCSKLYGISKKDNWNPADIWLVKDLNSVKRTLDSKIKDNTTSLQEFNLILRDMFHDRTVVGISLKKMSGKYARWELVNLDNSDVFDGDEYSFSFDEGQCLFSLKSNQKTFTNTDSTLKIGSSKQTIKFQIRQNSKGFNNLKVEATDISATGARLGKAPLDMVSQAFRSNRLEPQRWRSWKNYPRNSEEFDKERDVHISRFESLKKTGHINLGVRTGEEFADNVSEIFKTIDSDVANSKLMQLDLLNIIFSKTKGDKLNDMLSDIGYLAQKKGSLFGPFAKLY